MSASDDNWRALCRQVTARVRSMGVGDATAPGAAAPAKIGDELDQLLTELVLLDARYQHEQDRAFLDAKRQIADLEELHNANRLVTVGTLTVGMAHELGTPLGVVLARAQMIIADARDLADARNDAYAIVEQVKRMTQMCREVLDYARPKPPAKVPVDLVAVARHMIALLQPDARKRAAKLVLAGDPPPTWVLGNASKLEQVFTNLIINASQAMPKGGTVTIRVDRERVTPPPVAGLPESEYVRVHVQDNGTGIRGADLVHIFEMFFTTKKAGEGTGLGLPVSYRIAREHDGWIDVVTEEGRGSTFSVHLPPFAA